MNLNYNTGTLFDIRSMTIEIKKGSKAFQVDIGDVDGDLTATVRDMDSDTEIKVFTKRADTLEDLLKEVTP